VRRTLMAKLYHDRIEVVDGERVVACHARSFVRGDLVLDARHILRVLERKHRAVPESTAVQQWTLPPVFARLIEELRGRVRHANREWIQVLRLTEDHGLDDIEAAVHLALEKGSPRYATIKTLLRVVLDEPRVCEPAAVEREDLAALDVPAPDLTRYDDLGEVAR